MRRADEVHHVVVCGKETLELMLPHLLCHRMLRPKSHSLTRTESIFAHISMPSHRLAGRQRTAHHLLQLVQRKVEIALMLPVVRYFQYKGV